jgi:hypothetical protein
MVHLRKNRRSIAGLAASLFLAVWASMAIAPCLMAAEAIIGGDCPHCPEPPPPCHDPGGAGVCTYVDGYDFDGRRRDRYAEGRRRARARTAVRARGQRAAPFGAGVPGGRRPARRPTRAVPACT